MRDQDQLLPIAHRLEGGAEPVDVFHCATQTRNETEIHYR